jgi:hypothetical protein
MAVRCDLISILGVVVAPYGVVLIIYIGWHIYANFLAALAGLVAPGSAQHEVYPGGIRPSAVILYVASLPYPVSSTPILVLHCQT